jgi:hypothetical protein
MNEWSLRRKRVILFIVIWILVVLLGVPLFFLFHRSPTCSDGQMNGDEAGVDCGGTCKILCRAGTLPLLSKGDPRVLKIASSTYEVLAYVENPNPTAEVTRGSYVFKVFDAEGITPIKTIEGSTFIPKASHFVIFKGPFDFKDAVPVRATFEWKTETLTWIKNTDPVLEIGFKGSMFQASSTKSRLDSIAFNQTLQKVSNIEFVALIMDENSNIIGAAKTFVDAINPGESTPIVFTWSTPFTSTTTSFTILPRILPDRSYIQ